MSARIRRELDLLKVNKAVASLDNDVVQPGRCLGLFIALELHPGEASRRVKPVAQDPKALTILVDVPRRSDRVVLDVFRHGGSRHRKPPRLRQHALRTR